MTGLNNYLIYDMKNLSSTTKKLVIAYASTGTGMQEVVMNEDAVQLCPADSDNILVFGNNSSNQGVLEHYRLSTNLIPPCFRCLRKNTEYRTGGC
jgi:hypothetical protein